MRARTYDLLVRAIDAGIDYGWNRAHKHTDTPDEGTIKEQISSAIMNEISEYFSFEDEV